MIASPATATISVRPVQAGPTLPVHNAIIQHPLARGLLAATGTWQQIQDRYEAPLAEAFGFNNGELAAVYVGNPNHEVRRQVVHTLERVRGGDELEAETSAMLRLADFPHNRVDTDLLMLLGRAGTASAAQKLVSYMQAPKTVFELGAMHRARHAVNALFSMPAEILLPALTGALADPNIIATVKYDPVNKMGLLNAFQETPAVSLESKMKFLWDSIEGAQDHKR
ncbi:MAG: hypothetical protein HQM16_09105 [Deltaproteobacteria bacterium]|nr:hypothetical protein [Deltaproteobacteria bacterium]